MTTAPIPTPGLAPPNPLPPVTPVVHSFDASVTPSSVSTADGKLTKRTDPHLYPFTKRVYWKGESYLLSIDFPCKDWAKLGNDELRKAAEEYADIFLADLQTQLDTQTCEEGDKIKPGDDIAIHFQGEKGYVVYTQPGFDTHDTASKTKRLEATNDTSRELSKIISNNVTERDNYPAALVQKLQSSTLKDLRDKAIANKPVNLEPIKLEHNENNCFLNSAFQLLVNDPVLREDLRDPNNYIKDNDPLYNAIIAYDRHRSQSTPFQLPDLGVETTEQDDAVLGGLDSLTKNRFWEDTIPSFLPDPVKFEEGKTPSLEAIAKEQNKDLPNAFNIYVARAGDAGKIKDQVKGINDKGTISLTKDGQSKSYELTSFMVHIGDDIKTGHYVTYLRQGEQCWELNDLQSKIQSIPLKTFLLKAAQGSYFRFCEEETTKTMSASTSPAKEPNKVLEEVNDTNGSKIVIEKGSMQNAENYLLVHPSTKDITLLHPQFKEICPNLAAEIKTENSWRNLWGLRKISYEPTYIDVFGRQVAADIVQGSSNTIHVPLNYAAVRGPQGLNEIFYWTQDILNYAQKHGHRQLAFPIPDIHPVEGLDSTSLHQEQMMRLAIEDYMKEHPHSFRGGLDVKIIYPNQNKWNLEEERTTFRTPTPPPPPSADPTTTTPAAGAFRADEDTDTD